MKDGGALIWVLLLVVAVVVWIQFSQDDFFAPGPDTSGARKVAKPVWPQDKAGTVAIFGREYDEALVRGWFSKVDGRYCYRSGMVYAVGTAAGDLMGYDEFVAALKLGFFFPELDGAGTKSDGKTVILTHKPLRKRTRPSNSGQRSVRINK
jgi:hypothetical protein